MFVRLIMKRHGLVDGINTIWKETWSKLLKALACQSGLPVWPANLACHRIIATHCGQKLSPKSVTTDRRRRPSAPTVAGGVILEAGSSTKSQKVRFCMRHPSKIIRRTNSSDKFVGKGSAETVGETFRRTKFVGQFSSGIFFEQSSVTFVGKTRRKDSSERTSSGSAPIRLKHMRRHRHFVPLSGCWLLVVGWWLVADC